MRILGFSVMWDKLDNPEFSTFRYSRRDKDWWIGETVQVFFHPRSKGGGTFLGTARIISKERRNIDPTRFSVDPLEFAMPVTDKEAEADGFIDKQAMALWFRHTYGGKAISIMNKLTLKWIVQDKRR